MWILFLDDVRHPAEYVAQGSEHNVVWCQSLDQARYTTESRGLPEFMYLDHDLGGEDTSMDYLRWIGQIYDAPPPDYVIISANPVGSENIKSFMQSWKKSRTL